MAINIVSKKDIEKQEKNINGDQYINSYDRYQESKKEHYLEKSQKLKKKSLKSTMQAIALSGDIPLGEPIKLGHHSEKRHRKHFDNIDRKMSNAIELDKQSKYYEEKANSVGKGGISIKDCDAVQKINEKLKLIKNEHEIMIDANKLWRKTYRSVTKKIGLKNRTGVEAYYANNEELEAFKIAIEEFKKLDEKACKSLLSVVSMSQSNPTKLKPYYPDNSEIKRLEKRLKEINSITELDHKEIVKNNYTFIQNPEDKQFLFDFDSKPTYEVREILKSYSFKFSRYANAWVRMITNNSRYEVKRLIIKLDSIYA
jgi:hypothetical protein